MMNDTPIVEIRHLTYRFAKTDRPAIDDFSCCWKSGQLIGICGPDGAGKTTLMRLIAGLILPEPSTVYVGGDDRAVVENIPDDMMRYMPQKFSLYEDLTVLENLELYADLNCLSHERKSQEIERLLKFTQLHPFQKRLAGNLSGGMKQKLSLACALIKRPRLLLLDEPTVGVDPVSRKELWEMIDALVEDHMTIVYTTSALDELSHFGYVIILLDGKAIYQGSPSAIIERLTDRVFMISQLSNPKRVVFDAIDRHPKVKDCLIVSDSIRVFLHQDADEEVLFFLKQFGSLSTEKACFEDAFLEMMPAIPKQPSPIETIYPLLTISSQHQIEADELCKVFDKFVAVDKISFKVSPGEVFGLLGPNGAGKSTTFKMLCGLIKPTSGSAKIQGVSLMNSPTELKSKIGYMAQKFSLYGQMTVLQNLRFFHGIYPRYNAHDEVKEMIELFNLEPYLRSRAEDLPIGYKQRLSLACALMHRPEILFLDEPTSGVDPLTRREFWRHIHALVKKNVAIVITTHFMDEAEYCDRIGIVDQGRLIAYGSPDEIKRAGSQGETGKTMEEAFIALTRRDRP
jgi:ABC-2 type transport system ATP-binding protein